MRWYLIIAYKIAHGNGWRNYKKWKELKIIIIGIKNGKTSSHAWRIYYIQLVEGMPFICKCLWVEGGDFKGDKQKWIDLDENIKYLKKNKSMC